MKKLILTAVLAIATLFVSAQSFMVVTDLIKSMDTHFRQHHFRDDPSASQF